MNLKEAVKESKEGYLGFPSTAWTAILKAKERSSKEYRDRIGYLITMYWKPVYNYVRAIWKKSEEDATDLTQEFFCYVMEKNSLETVSPDKGRFRTFVKVSLKNFLINQQKMMKAQKRGGNLKSVSLDSIGDLTSPGPGDDEFFDKEWARTVITRCVKILKKTLVERNKEIYYKVYEMYDINPVEPGSLSYEHAAQKLGIKESDIRNYLFYARKLLKKIIEEEIKSYVLKQAEVPSEMKFLLSLKF